MLRALSHGQMIARVSGVGLRQVFASSEVAAMSDAPAEPTAATTADRFGYMFTGGGIAARADAFDSLGAVGSAMLGNGPIPGPTGLAAILTYFGQFVDHDITANTDRNPSTLPSFSIARPPLTVNARSSVKAQLGNLRRGTLRLDSVYGDGDAIDAKLRDGALMRVGVTTGGQPNDLPRYGPLIEAGVLSAADLPDTSQMKSDFGPVDARKLAFIADSRNDENLIVAQLHLAFLRFHNAIAATLQGDEETRFREAKRLVQWHYQWLVVERYLRAIGDPAVVADVIANGAARYAAFAAANGGANADHAPLPLEFSVAAFRFGHSMIRAGYVFNANFGPDGAIGVSTLRELFQFTGKGGFKGAPMLPDVWIIDWNNFLDSQAQDKAARGIDPLLARGLDDLVNEDKPHLRHLAQRNLRRGYVLDLPTAQTIIVQLRSEGIDIRALTTPELTAGSGGAALQAQDYVTDTPLWFYVLAEAEVYAGGRHLGPLGTLIVAETLVGLVALDPESYWHATGADEKRWSPVAAGLPGGAIENFSDMLKFSGVL